MYTETQNKIALACFDDKIFNNNNNISCLSFGHNKISNTA